MEDIVIIGLGQTPVGEHWELSVRQLGVDGIQQAIKDGGGMRPDAIYIGSFLTSMVSRQANLGSLLTDHAGMRGVESFTVEAAEASSAAALRMAVIAIRSGYINSALALGVEKPTDKVGEEVDDALMQGADYDFEGVQGLTMVGQAALLKQRYLHETQLDANALAPFPVIAHQNAVGNPYAMFRRAITPELYSKATMISAPLNLFDMAPYADGAAAVLLTRASLAPKNLNHPVIRITGAGSAIDRLALHDRPNPLNFSAVTHSFNEACRKAGIVPDELDFFEVDDAFSIYAALSLEAMGIAGYGEAPGMAAEGIFDHDGRLPILTMGGRKARGNTLGASGLYQAVEACLQLRGEAGDAQLAGRPKRAAIQSLGGPASTVVTHILEL
ncbi:MAG: thiolase domain-containing protein [Anaerolineaceae bacterium]|nr:thiolase domain-containing protein [Anaerolineaceae bacterium]